MKHELGECKLCSEPAELDELDADGWCEDCAKIVAKARAKNYPDFIKNRDPGDER
jgi:DNA-directed RNA polymerase subunit RPC12/RpoP